MPESGKPTALRPFRAERSPAIPATTQTSRSSLNTPYGGRLVNLLVDDARASELKGRAKDFASLTLDERGLCDLELLANGAFSPLAGFLGKQDYDRVAAEM